MATETATEAPEAPTEVPPAPAPPAQAAPAEKTADKKAAKAKDAKKDGKGKKKGEEAASDADGPSVAAHPRAARGVARAKGWGGLIGFALGGYLSLPTNTIAAAGLRALAAGVVCYIATWAGAVFLWRRLVMLELKGREQKHLAARQTAAAMR